MFISSTLLWFSLSAWPFTVYPSSSLYLFKLVGSGSPTQHAWVGSLSDDLRGLSSLKNDLSLGHKSRSIRVQGKQQQPRSRPIPDPICFCLVNCVLGLEQYQPAAKPEVISIWPRFGIICHRPPDIGDFVFKTSPSCMSILFSCLWHFPSKLGKGFDLGLGLDI